MAALIEEIADFALGLGFEDLPPGVLHEVKLRLIDSFACAMGGVPTPMGRLISDMAPKVEGGASIIGSGISTSPDFAAFGNGALISYLDFNDTYFSKEKARPSGNVAPAAAAAEISGNGGKDFLRALVAGYEVQLRLCDSRSLSDSGVDPSLWGTLSGTACASLLLGLSREEMLNALSMAGVTVTLGEAQGLWGKLTFPNAAKSALFFALLARAGVPGPRPVFEEGIERLLSGPIDTAPFEDTSFRILETSMKKYPAGCFYQSAISASLELSGEIEDVQDIEGVTVVTFGKAYETGAGGRPLSREEGAASLPFVVAVALFDRLVTVESFSEEKRKDPRLLALMDRVKVVRDPDLLRLYPGALPTRVEILLRTGEILSREVLYPEGHPRNPLGIAEVEEKFRRLSSWYFLDREAGVVLDLLWSLEDAEDIRKILRHFTRGRAYGMP